MARQLDPWGGMDSMLRVLNDMEYRRDKAKETKTNRMMSFLVEQQKMQDTRTERNVSALEAAWRNAKSPAQRGLHQAKAKNLVGRNPRLRNRLSNITGGILDLNLEKAEGFKRDNQKERHRENETLADQSRIAFKNQHIDDRYKHIRLTGGIAGTPLTNTLPLDEWENKETGRKVARFQTYSMHNGLPVYGTIDETDMNVIQAAKIYGGGDKGNTAREIAATGGVSFTRDGQVGLENVKFKTFIPVFGPKKGVPQTQIEGLPKDLDTKRKFIANVLASHGRGGSPDAGKEEDVYREQMYTFFDKDASPAQKNQALTAMNAKLPGYVPAMINKGARQDFFQWRSLIHPRGIGGWVSGEKEELAFVRGNFIDAKDSTGAKFRLIYNPETNTILDSTGKPFTMSYTDPDGNPKQYSFKSPDEVEAYLRIISYKDVKSGKAEAPAPWSISAPAKGYLRTIAEYQGVEVAVGDQGGYYLRKPGGNWYTPKSDKEKVFADEVIRRFSGRRGGAIIPRGIQ
ncbi:MAG TPA: hypothetical protein ENI27_08555 [bacterium]|nr:hypothetical protein [bacterium]